MARSTAPKIAGKIEGGVFRQDVPFGCPMCAYKMNAASAMEGAPRAPSVGDYSICIRCTSVLVFGDRALEIVTPAQWADTSEEQQGELVLIARAHEQASRRVDSDFAIDTVITRGPTDFRAALTMKNGLFVVSAPLNTRKKAQRLLRRARTDAMLLARWTEVSADALSEGVRAEMLGWYGMVQLAIVGQEYDVSPHLGPYPTQTVAIAEVRAHAWRLAEVLGVRAAGEIFIDRRDVKPGSGN